MSILFIWKHSHISNMILAVCIYCCSRTAGVISLNFPLVLLTITVYCLLWNFWIEIIRSTTTVCCTKNSQLLKPWWSTCRFAVLPVRLLDGYCSSMYSKNSQLQISTWSVADSASSTCWSISLVYSKNSQLQLRYQLTVLQFCSFIGRSGVCTSCDDFCF